MLVGGCQSKCTDSRECVALAISSSGTSGGNRMKGRMMLGSVDEKIHRGGNIS